MINKEKITNVQYTFHLKGQYQPSPKITHSGGFLIPETITIRKKGMVAYFCRQIGKLLKNKDLYKKGIRHLNLEKELLKRKMTTPKKQLIITFDSEASEEDITKTKEAIKNHKPTDDNIIVLKAADIADWITPKGYIDPKSQQITELFLSKVEMLEYLSINSLVGINYLTITDKQKELLNYLASYNKLRINSDNIIYKA